MKSIQRYTQDRDMVINESAKGEYVLYADLAALREKCEMLEKLVSSRDFYLNNFAPRSNLERKNARST